MRLKRSSKLTDRLGQCRSKIQLEADDVLIHLRNALFLDPLDLFRVVDGGFEIKPIDEIPLDARRCISKLKHRTRYTKDGDKIVEVELDLMSKDNMMSLAMKHLGLLDRPEEEQREVGNEQIVAYLLEQVENKDNIIDAQVIEQKVITDGKGLQ